MIKVIKTENPKERTTMEEWLMRILDFAEPPCYLLIKIDEDIRVSLISVSSLDLSPLLIKQPPIKEEQETKPDYIN